MELHLEMMARYKAASPNTAELCQLTAVEEARTCSAHVSLRSEVSDLILCVN